MNTANPSVSRCSTRNTITIGLFFVLFFLNSVATSAQNTATISGTIESPASTSVQLSVDPLHLASRVETKTNTLNNGQFQFTVNLMQGDLVELMTEGTRLKLFVEPGNDLQMQLKGNAITFSGKGAEQNTFLKKFYDQFKNDFDDSVMHPKMLASGVDAFEMSIFDNRKKQHELFKKDPDKNNFSPSFNEFMQHTINFRYWNLLLSYPIINANSHTGLTVTPLPAVMLDGFAKVPVNNDAAVNCEPYREFLKYYVIYFTSQLNGFKKFTDFSISADKKLTLANERLKGEAFKFWLAKFTIDECARLSPFMIKKLVAALKETDKEGKYTSTVNSMCSERMVMKEVKKETPANSNETATLKNVSKDELDLTDVNGKHVSMSDFKGKVVYIDFWASWCGPCRKMMPFSKQMHENLTEKQKKEIVFLYISIDADVNAWKKGIGDLNIQGINVNSPGNWSSKACKYFQINSIPRYMIMDKKGNIVDTNAKRPADSSVLNELMKLAAD